MGGAVSSGESNDDLIDNLLEAAYIKSPLVERVFRAVDRSMYYTQAYKMNAYKDLAWKDGNLHLSAPCIYSEVMENIKLEPGMSFLNIGSGTGYLSTMCGLMIGRGGINHGIELYPDVVEYARNKQHEFLRVSPAIDMFDFCPPEFIVGNCLDPIVCKQRYDRIYCGAACPEESIRNITDLLKIGGICVIPINDSLVQITRISEDKEDRNSLLPVSFANLISSKTGEEKIQVRLPDWNPPSLQDLCRSEIRTILRTTIMPPGPRTSREQGRKKRRRRRQERRRASRLLVVQRRRSGGEDGETGFVAVAYSVGHNSSDEEGSVGNRQNETGHNRIGTNTGELSRDNEDEAMQGQRIGSSGEEEDDFELPELVDEAMQQQQDVSSEHESGSELRPSAPVPPAVEHDGPSAGSSSGNHRSGDNGSSNSLGRSRGFRAFRARNARQGAGADGIFGRLREIYRRREQQSRIEILGQFEQSLQQLSSLYTSAAGVINANRRGPTPSADDAVVAPMEEDSHSAAEPANLNRRRLNAVVNNGNGNDGDWVAGGSSSLDSSSSSSSSTSDDSSIEQDENNQGNDGTESGVATDMDKNDDASVPSMKTDDKGKENYLLPRFKREPFSIEMKTKIKELPLPPSIKVYLNYNRPL